MSASPPFIKSIPHLCVNERPKTLEVKIEPLKMMVMCFHPQQISTAAWPQGGCLGRCTGPDDSIQSQTVEPD